MHNIKNGIIYIWYITCHDFNSFMVGFGHNISQLRIAYAHFVTKLLLLKMGSFLWLFCPPPFFMLYSLHILLIRLVKDFHFSFCK